MSNNRHVSSSKERSISVVGAGPVGSLAALAFAERGFNVDLYDRGHQPDPVTGIKPTTIGNSRSINLTLSTRAITALEMLGIPSTTDTEGKRVPLVDQVLDIGLPVSGRMIHKVDATPGDTELGGASRVQLEAQAYGTDPLIHSTYSISRPRLSDLMLKNARQHPRITVHHGMALKDVRFLSEEEGRRVELDFKKNPSQDELEDSFEHVPGLISNQNDIVTKTTDFVIGTDGMHSVVRQAMDREVSLEMTKNFIETQYIELVIPAIPVLDTDDIGRWPLDPAYLHIWPKHTFLLIAFPNNDRSFTCTLFAQEDLFNGPQFSTAEGIISFFRVNFPDALPLIGEGALVRDIMRRKERPGRLGMVRSKIGRYHETLGRAVLLGDAAHAMVPFYGQGLNCGLEDVRVLMEVLEGCGVLPPQQTSYGATFNGSTSFFERSSLQSAMEEYSKVRHPAIEAILQLAQDNYIELRHGVVSPSYLARRWLDERLMRIVPSVWTPRLSLSKQSVQLSAQGTTPADVVGPWKSRYMLVTFSNVPYHRAMRQAAMQDRFVTWVVMLTVVLLFLLAVLALRPLL